MTGGDHSLPPMNALEILRETARVLRHSPSPFLSILFLLICPVSAAIFSVDSIATRPVSLLSRRLLLLAASSGLPPSSKLLRQICHHLSSTLLSAAICLPLLLSLLLLARSAAAFSVASSYAQKPVPISDILSLVRRIWRRLLLTYLTICASIALCFSLFLLILTLTCKAVSSLGYPPEIVVYPALLILLVFSVIYAHTIIVCNLAGVISVLEELSGIPALLRSVRLIQGQTQAGLLIFLGSTIGMAFVEGLFEHRVKTLSYGDGSSRIWEGPLLVIMHSFVVLIDFMMSAVFYFTCRSAGVDLSAVNGEGEGNSLLVEEEMEKLSWLPVR